MSRRVVPEPEPIWRVLADPTRRAILDQLRSGPQGTGALAEAFPTTRFAVMKHLAVLVEAGLVTVERRGRERLNHLNPVPLRQVYERWVRPTAEPSVEAVLRLAEHAESSEELMEYGLDVRTQHAVRASVERTWRSLLALTDWWPPCWPDDARLLFEPRLGGRLGTVYRDNLDAGSLWGLVTVLEPGHELAVDGSMGMPGPVVGQWRMALRAAHPGTEVTLTHRVLGHVDEECREGFTMRWPQTLASLGEHTQRSA